MSRGACSRTVRPSPTEASRDSAAPGAGGWRERLSVRLAGSRPRHAPDDWLFPGLTPEQSQSLRTWFPSAPIPAAVLVPIIEREEPTVLLTQRATQMRQHAGQISFPGGRIETVDVGPAEAALREAREEIGLEPRFVSIAGYLPDHIVLTGYRVTPVVAFVQPGFELLLDADEVAESFEMPLAVVLERASYRSRRRRLDPGDMEFEVFDLPYAGRNIWGATAGMLLALRRMLETESGG